MAAYGYVRVSTDTQDNSLENQQQKIRDWCEREDLDLVNVYVDEDISGSVPLRNRPQGRLLWDQMDHGDTVIFCKVDRVFRSVRDAADTVHNWQQKGVRAVILDLGIDLATPAGRMFFHQLASFAEFEREMIGQRTREIAAYLKKNGRPYGGARPFGWRKVGSGRDARYEPCEAERDLAFRVLDLVEQGYSFRQIVWLLAKERIVKPGKRHTDRGKGVWYGVTEVHGLAMAARLGFPIVPRSALLVSGRLVKPNGCLGRTPQRDLSASAS